MRNFDTVIVEMINDACNPNYLPKERARFLTNAIEAVFSLF